MGSKRCCRLHGLLKTESRGFVAIILGIIFVVYAIAIIKVPVFLKDELPTKGIRVASAVVAVLISLICFVPGEDKAAMPEGSLTERIKFLAPDVVEVREMEDTLVITHLNQTVASGEYWVWAFFTDAENILKRLPEASHNRDYKQIVFMVRVPTRDNLGNAGDTTGMKVFYSRDKLKQAKWDNMTTFDLMEIPDDIQIRRLGRDMVAEYCKDDSKRSLSPRFCGRV